MKLSEMSYEKFSSVLWFLGTIIITLIIVIPITIGSFKDKEIKLKELEIQTYGEMLNSEEKR